MVVDCADGEDGRGGGIMRLYKMFVMVVWVVVVRSKVKRFALRNEVELIWSV